MILKILDKLKKKNRFDRGYPIQNFTKQNHGLRNIIYYLEKDLEVSI